jgi:predicted phosphodiesterase
MRYGLLADIHGNLAALEQALAVLEREGVDRYVVAGDIVGYGPAPNECVEVVAGLGATCVAGNHDLIAIGALGADGAGALARATLEWTRSVLGADARAWLSALPARARTDGVVVAHGSLDDPCRYVLDDLAAARELAALRVTSDATLLVLGHTHLATTFGSRSRRVLGHGVGRADLGAGERWLVNPGAVGQSRDGGVLALAAVLDTPARTSTQHAFAYDIAATRDALARTGLPAAAIQRPPARPERGLRALTRRAVRHARAARALTPGAP